MRTTIELKSYRNNYNYSCIPRHLSDKFRETKTNTTFQILTLMKQTDG